MTDQQVFERDSWRCQIQGCGLGRIRADLRWPHPLSPSIDHIVPLSWGGTDTAPNKRAAHLACNLARGNRMGLGDLPVVTPELAPLGLMPPKRRRKCPVHGQPLPWPKRCYYRRCRWCGTEVRSTQPSSRELTVCSDCRRCSSCGKRMAVVANSLPPQTRLCQPCRRKRRLSNLAPV